MEPQEYDTLFRRLDTALTGINATLASLNTKQQRLDVTLIALDATTEAIRDLLTQHQQTFERLGRLLDERLPPSGNGH